jgi:hypothetical protein
MTADNKPSDSDENAAHPDASEVPAQPEGAAGRRKKLTAAMLLGLTMSLIDPDTLADIAGLDGEP